MLAGDGIRIDLPVALMERAATTGWVAANHLLSDFGLAGTPCTRFPTTADRRCCAAWRPAEEAQSMSMLSDLKRDGQSVAVPDTSPHDMVGAGAHLRGSRPGGDPGRRARVAAPPERQLVRVRRESQIAQNRWAPPSRGCSSSPGAGRRGLQVAPGACPHLGADLATATVECGTLVCPWHGLRLDATPRSVADVSGVRRRRIVLGAPGRCRR